MASMVALKGAFGIGSDEEIVDGVGQPLRRGLDEAPAQLGKLGRYTLINQIIKCADGREFKARKNILTILIIIAEITRAGVNADRQVQPLRLFVQRKQRGFGQQATFLLASHEDA